MAALWKFGKPPLMAKNRKSRPINRGDLSPHPQRSCLPQPGLLPPTTPELPGGLRQEPHLSPTMSQSPAVGGQHAFLWSLCTDSLLTEWEGPLPFPATSAALPSVHSAHQWNLQLQMLQDHTDHSAWTPSASPDISIDGPNLGVQSCIDYLLLPGDPSICDITCA